jgi:hypothetical protein
MTIHLRDSARLRLWLRFGAIVALMIFPGCMFLAVQSVRAVDRKLDPPQKPLAGAAGFFGNEVTATARLFPLSVRRRDIFSNQSERDDVISIMDWDDAPLKVEDKDKLSVPKVVFVSLVNRGAKDARITVDAVDTSLGSLAPVPLLVLLAPGQRALIATIRSTSEPKIEALDVTVRLRANEQTEARTLALHAR